MTLIIVLIITFYLLVNLHFIKRKEAKKIFFPKKVVKEEDGINNEGLSEKEENAIEQLKKQLKYLKPTAKPTVVSKFLDPRLGPAKVKQLLTSSFIDGIKSHASPSKTIVLSLVDLNYLSFAENFYELSIRKNSLNHFSFICLDKDSLIHLHNKSIPCVLFEFPSSSEGSSSKNGDFGSKNYLFKTNLKTAVMIQVLHLGYSVLMIDVDVILFKDPFQFFTCKNCSIHIQLDRQMYNSGFVFARPAESSKELYEISWRFFIQFQKSHDQAYLNMAVQHMKKMNKLSDLVELPKNQFLCGVYYFEHVHRPFKNQPPCDECVMVHNNYLATIAAKKYRLLENHLWLIDEDKYYSDEHAKYITYDNPFTFLEHRVLDIEISTLKTALTIASVLKRILILPSFHCCNCEPDNRCSHPKYKCSLLSVLKVSKFNRYFHLGYRENSFLSHPLVPDKVKSSVTPMLLINSTFYGNTSLNVVPGNIFHPKSLSAGAEMFEIEKWMKHYQNYSVINFHSLYGAHSTQGFHHDDRYRQLRNMFEEAIECSEYEQWDKNSLQF